MLTAVWIVAAIVGLYGLHRLMLRLEQQGYVYYKHKKPSSGAASMFMPLHEFYEPQIQHVFQVEEQRPLDQEGRAGDPRKPGKTIDEHSAE